MIFNPNKGRIVFQIRSITSFVKAYTYSHTVNW